MLVYRNPNADWKSSDKVKLDPVTIRRGGDNPLKDVPDEELKQHGADIVVHDLGELLDT